LGLKQKSLVLVLVLVFALSLTGCAGSGSGSAEKPQLVFGDASWASIQVHNRIAGFIVEHGYGYPAPKYVFGESLPTLQGMGKGDIDVLMEIWADNYKEAWNKLLNEGKVKDLGSNFPDSTQGWYVPTYMIKGDPERGIEPVAPDLKSVEDLPKYWELFKDPEVPTKGRFHQSPPGWKCTEINEIKFETYGLSEYYNLFSTGSQTALAASMVSAYNKGEPWVGYYWEPTWVMGQLDMTLLEEPPYDEETWDENYGCAYPPSTVLIGINSELEEKAPEVVAFLKKYETTTAQVNAALAYMHNHGDDVEAAAIWFLKEYPDTWEKWIPEDVAAKVEKALDEVE